MKTVCLIFAVFVFFPFVLCEDPMSAQSESLQISTSGAFMKDQVFVACERVPFPASSFKTFTSLAISKGDEMLAVMNAFHPEDPIILGTNLQAQVTGKLTSNEEAFIKLEWTEFGESETGQYSCETYTLDPQGQTGHLKVAIQVDAKPENDYVLEDTISQLSEAVTAQEEALQAASNSMAQQMERLQQQGAAIQKLDEILKAIGERLAVQGQAIEEAQARNHEVQRLQNSTSQMKQNLDELQATVNALKESAAAQKPLVVQKGTRKCPDGSSFVDGPTKSGFGDKYGAVDIPFDSAFSSPPSFYMGLSYLDTKSSGAMVNLKAASVSEAGATVNCISWKTEEIYEAAFEWIAIGY